MITTSNAFTKILSPFSADGGLLALRLSVGIVLFLRHGWEKRPGQWQSFTSTFPDPVGIGPYASFLVAFVGDFVCPLLLFGGLGTRWAALYALGNIFVAWALVHHFAFFGKAPAADHGELIVLYLGAMLTIAIMGGGAFSIDHLLLKE